MATTLTHAIIDNAKTQVDAYITTANSLYEELSQIIETLTANDFTGDASDGYRAFFMEQVTPALTENLTTGEGSLMEGLKKILEGIETQILNTTDPQLGENNRNPGGAQ